MFSKLSEGYLIFGVDRKITLVEFDAIPFQHSRVPMETLAVMLRPDKLSKPLFISGFVSAALSAFVDSAHIPDYDLSDVTPVGVAA